MENNAGYVNDASFSFEGNPESFNVEQEVENTVGGLVYDPYRLSEVLVTIGEKMTGIPLYEYQRGLAFRIIYSILARDGAEITALFSRQSGKSEVIVFCVIVLGILLPVLAKIYPKELGYYSNGIKIGLFAPQGEQVQTVYQRCVARLHSEPVKMFLDDPDILDAPTSSVHFKLKSGTHVTGQSAAKQSKIESKTYNLVFIDESQDVDTEKVRKSIIPMTASCVCAGTMVYNEMGQRLPIEKFVDTETKIIGYDGSDSFADTISWKQNKTGKKECFRITTNSGRTLECSFDHPILAKPRDTRKLEYINTENLSVGTQIAIIDKVDLFGNESMINPRLVGMLIGDGNYTKDTTVSFSNADKELWSFIENTHKVTYSKYSHITKDGRLYKEGTIPGLCGELRKLGIYGQVSKSKRLPDNIDQYRREDILELIGGLFDTDGTICVRDGRRGSISITAVGLPLIQDVFFLLDKLGIHGRIDFVKPNILGYAGLNAKGAWKYTINEKISIERFCREIKLLVPAKQAKLNKLVDIFSNRKAKRQKNIEGLYFERVTSIQPLGVQTIYNLSAETHQNYVSNGIVTHNTFGTVVRTGTPGRNKGDFYYVIQNNKKDDKKLTSPKQKLKFQKHFEFNYKDVIRYKREQYKKDGKDFHLLYEKAVLRDKKSSGENSDYFRMSYRIEWLLDVGMFITEERLNEKVYNKKIIFPKTSPKDFVVAGLDIASARANTVLTTALLDTMVQEFGERPVKTLTSWTVLNDLNYEEQFHIIANSLLEHNVKVLYSDYTGVGRALTDILMYHLGELIEIIPYTFTPSSKSDMWKALDEDIENERLIVPAHRTVRETSEFKMFDEQMLNLQKYWKGSFMVCEKTQGFKDDFCDSLGMCNLAGNHLYTPSTSVEITSNNLLGTGYRNNLRNNSRW